MSTPVQISNLTKHYDGFTLGPLDLEVPAGCVVGLIGSNGSGKTTTIKSLLGLIKPDDGSVALFGKPMAHGSSEANTVQIKQRIGVVFDTCEMLEDLTIKDIDSIMRYSYPTWDAALFAKFLRDFSLDPKKTIKSLSRGMGMKLQIACALSHKPDLLILDEATAGLDPLARSEVLDLLRSYLQEDDERCILMSSHITSDLEHIADEIICIDEGEILFDLPKDAITDEAGIARCRQADFAALCESGFFAPKTMRYQENRYGIDVLVPDRAAFMSAFDQIACDRCTIDDYMTLHLKGALK